MIQMKKIKSSILLALFTAVAFSTAIAQGPKSYTSAEIYQQLKKLKVIGSILYIAAHPDDENTRLLGWLANEKLVRTGYLSLTRGDGGQNLIGNEQGIDLGLIRTQELLAARRVDGAEQFFTRAFDFGFSKNPDETFQFWNKQRILADVVFVIRKFRPDIVITRFPVTGEGGHGHHTASGILAEEAFDLVGNPQAFPEQLKEVAPWQPKRLLWNSFNFGTTNTTNENQLKINIGSYNPMLGKSYGEIAALSRSQHKSQGFGVPSQRGDLIEYFQHRKGATVQKDIFDDISFAWNKYASGEEEHTQLLSIESDIDRIIEKYKFTLPQHSLPALVKLYEKIEQSALPEHWRKQKLKELLSIIENCSGLHIEATTNTAFAVQGDSLKITLVVNNRQGDSLFNADCKLDDTYVIFDQLAKNSNRTKVYTQYINPTLPLSQPYWLEQPLEGAMFGIPAQSQVGMAESKPMEVDFSLMIYGKEFIFRKPVQYKYTDPIRGEIFEPVNIVPSYFVGSKTNVVLLHQNKQRANVAISLRGNLLIKDEVEVSYAADGKEIKLKAEQVDFALAKNKEFEFEINKASFPVNKPSQLFPYVKSKSLASEFTKEQNVIQYDHIPQISYSYVDAIKVLNVDLNIAGKKVGYIKGAGDKVAELLVQMGYQVSFLDEADITADNIKSLDAIVTGVRAHNVNDWMPNVYDVLMNYVKNGGVLVNQYNTNNQLGALKSKIAPYPFTIGRGRITDEKAVVKFLLPKHQILNYPNKITEKDFEGWIQERSIYNAEKMDSSYQRIFAMKDGTEAEQEGSLIVANYGKGKYVYTGIVFFRELPAAVPGAIRLLANVLAKPTASEKALVTKKK